MARRYVNIAWNGMCKDADRDGQVREEGRGGIGVCDEERGLSREVAGCINSETRSPDFLNARETCKAAV